MAEATVNRTGKKGKRLLWWVVGLLLAVNVVVMGGVWLFVKSGQGQGKPAESIVHQTPETARPAAPTGKAAVAVTPAVSLGPEPTLALEELKARFEPVEWKVTKLTATEIVLEGKLAGDTTARKIAWTISRLQGSYPDLQVGQKVKASFASAGELRITPLKQ